MVSKPSCPSKTSQVDTRYCQFKAMAFRLLYERGFDSFERVFDSIEQKLSKKQVFLFKFKNYFQHIS